MPRKHRFLERLAACATHPDACWIYPVKPAKDGYVQISVDSRRLQAHRAVYEFLFGPIPEGLTLDHLCRNHPCCNPWHMEPVTDVVNVLRGFGPCAMNARKTECIRGHHFTSENTYLDTAGKRQCKACRRIRENNDRRREQKRAAYRGRKAAA